MSKSSEIKCKLMAPAEATKIATVINDELRDRNFDDLARALKKIPHAVVKIKGVPRVSAVAVIGYKSSKIKDLSHGKDPDGNIFIKFKTPEDAANSHHQLAIPRRSRRSPQHAYFFGDRWGNIPVGLAQATEGKPAVFAPMLASMTQTAREHPRGKLNRFFNFSDCVVVTFSNTRVTTPLEKEMIGNPGTFGIVQQAAPVRAR